MATPNPVAYAMASQIDAAPGPNIHMNHTKAVEAGNEKNAAILDTLALAQQMTGDIDAAIETLIKAAVSRTGDCKDRKK